MAKAAASEKGDVFDVKRIRDLIDLMEEGVCDLSGVSYLVLDEADRMLDQG